MVRFRSFVVFHVVNNAVSQPSSHADFPFVPISLLSRHERVVGRDERNSSVSLRLPAPPVSQDVRRGFIAYRESPCKTFPLYLFRVFQNRTRRSFSSSVIRFRTSWHLIQQYDLWYFVKFPGVLCFTWFLLLICFH